MNWEAHGSSCGLMIWATPEISLVLLCLDLDSNRVPSCCASEALPLEPACFGAWDANLDSPEYEVYLGSWWNTKIWLETNCLSRCGYGNHIQLITYVVSARNVRAQEVTDETYSNPMGVHGLVHLPVSQVQIICSFFFFLHTPDRNRYVLSPSLSRQTTCSFSFTLALTYHKYLLQFPNCKLNIPSYSLSQMQTICFRSLTLPVANCCCFSFTHYCKLHFPPPPPRLQAT
jgi:hypothetical protein